jgi:hypothetical protein
LFLGYLLGLIGLAFKLRGSRQEVEWRPGPDGGEGVLRGWGWGCDCPDRLSQLGSEGDRA